MPEQRLLFGEEPELYDRVRPWWPEKLIDDVVALVGLPCRAVDAGCGTGRAAVQLARRGAVGIGVEPDARMAAVALRNLAAFPGWRVDESDFEDWSPGVGEGQFDLIVSAESWHWIDRDRGGRQAERLLRPGGWLALVTNEDAPEDSPLRREIDAIYAELAPEPSGRSMAPHKRLLVGLRFGKPIEAEHPWSRDFSAGEWLALLTTSSDHRRLPSEQRALLLAAVAAAIDRHGGRYRAGYLTRLWAVQRMP